MSYYSHSSVWQHFKSDNTKHQRGSRGHNTSIPLGIVNYFQPVWRANLRDLGKLEMATYIIYDPETVREILMQAQEDMKRYID